MLNSLHRFNGINSSLLNTSNNEKYQNRVLQQLCKVALIAALMRLTILIAYYNSSISINEVLVNIIPILTLLITVAGMQLQKITFAKYFVMLCLPLALFFVAVYYLDKSALTLLLLFSVIAFILFDTIKVSSLHFLYSNLLFLVGVFYIGNANGSLEISNHYIVGLINYIIFFFVFYLVLILLKNSFNHVFKKVYNDNTALNEMNSDLMNMHQKLVQKNKVLETEQNLMASDSEKNNKLFSIISHDVKAPLISIKNILEYTKEEKDADQLKEFLPEIRKTISNTVGLLENLLIWSKSKETNLVAKQEIIHLNGMLDKVMELYGVTIKSKNLLVEVHNDVNLFVQFNKDMLYTVLRNVIGNAVKYSKQDGTIELKAIRSNDKVTLQISNTAYTVSDEQIALLNSRDEVSNTSLQNEIGSGLGLIIVKDFLQKNNAPIQFYNENNRFITCEIEFQSYNNQVLTAISNKGKKDYLVASK